MHTKVVAYPGDQKLAYEELIDLAAEALPKEGDFFILGESFSGPVAIALAARGDTRLCGLILACSFASNPLPLLAPLRHLARFLPPPSMASAALSYALMGHHATPGLRTSLAAALDRVDPAVLRHRAQAALSVDATAALRSVRCPVLLLQATEDRVVPAASASRMQRACPQARLVRLQGPHFLLQACAKASAAVITAFVDEVVQGVAEQRAR